MKTTRQQFKEAIISAIHGLPYEEALGIENNSVDVESDGFTMLQTDDKEIWHIFPITIGRVIQALHNNERKKKGMKMYKPQIGYEVLELGWKGTEEDGQEADDDFQDDSTIEALLELLKPPNK